MKWTSKEWLEAVSLFIGVATLLFGGLSFAELAEIVLGLAGALIAL